MKFKKSQQQIDPYEVGKELGPAAFCEGDWVIIRPSENHPARVKRVDITGSVCVILGEESDLVHGEASYYPSCLGYPINSEFWSEYQKEQYQLLLSRRHLTKRRKLIFDELHLPPIFLNILAILVVSLLATITAYLFLNVKTINKSMDILWTSFFLTQT
jgi:hypothetical protein